MQSDFICNVGESPIVESMFKQNILSKIANYFFLFVFMTSYMYASENMVNSEATEEQSEDSWDDEIMNLSIEDLRINELHIPESLKTNPIPIEALENAKLQLDENHNEYDVHIAPEDLESCRKLVLNLCKELNLSRNDCVYLYLVIKEYDNKAEISSCRWVLCINEKSWVLWQYFHVGDRTNIKQEHIPLFLPVVPKY